MRGARLIVMLVRGKKIAEMPDRVGERAMLRGEQQQRAGEVEERAPCHCPAVHHTEKAVTGRPLPRR